MVRRRKQKGKHKYKIKNDKHIYTNNVSGELSSGVGTERYITQFKKSE